jgi:transposase
MVKREDVPRLVSTRRDTAGKRLLEIHRLGPHPIIEHFLEQIGVARILDKHIHSNREGVLSHGRAISVLVHNVLVSRDPLYRLTEWAEPIDPQALGLTPQEKLALNDDRMGRALDQLAEYAGRGVFFQLALRCIKLFELETRRIHFDTTTVTVTGEYAGSLREPVITHGHNKDYKPHLKQLVFGLNVTADGAVPLSHQVSSGNRTDDTFHRDNFDALRDLLAKDDFIYVADSKLCTKENLKHIHDFGGKFVTVMPQTRKEDTTFRQKLRHKAGRWRHMLTVEVPGGHGRVETYSITVGPEKTEDGFRLLWLRSSAKAELDRTGRQKRLEKAKAALRDLHEGLNQRQLKTEKQIRDAVRKILKEHSCEEFLRVKISSKVLTTTKRLRPGRPKPGDPREWVSEIVYDLEVAEQAVRLRQEGNTDGVFPLVTNIPPKEARAVEILQMYRYQPHLERRFQNLKTEYAVAPVYLKKPERVVGLLHVYFLALTVGALLEREIRRRMEKEGIEALPIYPEERECQAPTSPRIFELFAQVDWFRHVEGDASAVFPVTLSGLQEQVLKLLGVPRASYEETAPLP